MTEKKLNLLEKARTFRPAALATSSVTEDEVEVAIAWAKGEIRYSQAQYVLKGETNCYPTLARGLREAVRKGILK